jgi:16S rRNA (cytosine1402-N4)-methyltransferase
MRACLPKAATDGGETVEHRPVLLSEILSWLRPASCSTIIDCTIGPGGHAERLLEALGPKGRLVGIDRDGEALALARRRLERFTGRVLLRQADYRDLDGVLRDPVRGFGFSSDGPLDMRLDRTRGETAAQLLERLDEHDLARTLWTFGEEPRARAIARAIIRERGGGSPIATTSRLAAIVARACRGGTARRIHPATRTFMALRIAVNDELSGLERFVEDAAGRLGPGGRMAVISFHSLEDRAVKKTLRALASRCTCPPRMPRCGCGRPDLLRVLTPRPVVPSLSERSENPRSRSAKLRVAEKL